MEAPHGISSPTVAADHPGINELFTLLAYGEVAAFYRLTEEARMAPDLRGRINMARMAAAEMAHYELLRTTLEGRGVDVIPAITRYAPALEQYHRLTTPSTWLEALVKTYVGDAMAADLYLLSRFAKAGLHPPHHDAADEPEIGLAGAARA